MNGSCAQWNEVRPKCPGRRRKCVALEHSFLLKWNRHRYDNFHFRKSRRTISINIARNLSEPYVVRGACWLFPCSTTLVALQFKILISPWAAAPKAEWNEFIFGSMPSLCYLDAVIPFWGSLFYSYTWCLASCLAIICFGFFPFPFAHCRCSCCPTHITSKWEFITRAD